MKNLNKILTILGVKGVLCLVSLTIIALALVTYTAILTVSPTQQFTIGATTSSWTVYVNDVDKVKFLPGGASEPTFNANDPNTYAFKVTTDASQVCAVKIELTSPVSDSKFSKFQINVKYWDGSTWADETLYANPTGSTTKPYIDGLTAGDVGYIHQDLSTIKYYLIKVTYSYDKVDETTQVTVNFQYTPLPQNSF
ncbi:MAG: hypothetical protein QXI91_05170 [Candidatus Bathyarchaeia archaeon]